MKPILAILGTLVGYEVTIQGIETYERHKFWNVSREYCEAVGKPLLRIGIRRSKLEPPNGDVTLDLDLAVLKIPGGVVGDERDIPFADKQFGVCFNEHTLEHLHSAEDVNQAVKECARVADYAVFLTPSPYSLWSNFFCETHRLRIFPHDSSISVEEVGLTPVGRALVAYGTPPTVTRARINPFLQQAIRLMGGRPRRRYETGYEWMLESEA